MAINPMAYSSKDVVLDVVRTERSQFYDVIDNPSNWLVDTRCEGWQVRDGQLQNAGRSPTHPRIRRHSPPPGREGGLAEADQKPRGRT